MDQLATTLTLTAHAAVRIAQRGITSKDAELIALIGTKVDGGYLVRTKDYQQVERELKSLLNRVRRLVGKRLIIADGQIITAYHASVQTRRRLLRYANESDLCD
jgi:hypothetical protein